MFYNKKYNFFMSYLHGIFEKNVITYIQQENSFLKIFWEGKKL